METLKEMEKNGEELAEEIMEQVQTEVDKFIKESIVKDNIRRNNKGQKIARWREKDNKNEYQKKYSPAIRRDAEGKTLPAPIIPPKKERVK